MSTNSDEGDGNKPALPRSPSGRLTWGNKVKNLLGRSSSSERLGDLNRELEFLGLSEETAGSNKKTTTGEGKSATSSSSSPDSLQPSPSDPSPTAAAGTPHRSSLSAPPSPSVVPRDTPSPMSQKNPPSPQGSPAASRSGFFFPSSPQTKNLVPPEGPYGPTRRASDTEQTTTDNNNNNLSTTATTSSSASPPTITLPTNNIVDVTPPGTPTASMLPRSSSSSFFASIDLAGSDPEKTLVLRESRGSAEETAVDAKTNEQRLRVVNELLLTEETYVTSLQIIYNDYYKPMKVASMLYGVTRQQVTSIFSCFEALMVFHQSFLTELRTLEAEVAKEGSLASIWTLFLKQADYLKMYSTYMTNYPKAAQVISELRDQPKFQGLLTRNREKRGLDLMSYLIMPVQRIPRYELLLREVIKSTPATHPEYPSLSTLFSKVQEIARSINEGQRQMENMSKLLEIQNRMTSLGGMVLMSPGRSLVRDGPLVKFASGFLGTQSSHTRLFFLFNDKLLWSTTKYEYRGHVELVGATVTEMEPTKSATPKSPRLDQDPNSHQVSRSPSRRFGTLTKDFKISQALAFMEQNTPASPTRVPPTEATSSLKIGLSPRVSRLSLSASVIAVPSLKIEGTILTKGDSEGDADKTLVVTASSMAEHEAWKADLESTIKAYTTAVAVNKDRRTSFGVVTTVLVGEDKRAETGETSEAEKNAAAAGVSKQLIAATKASPPRRAGKLPSSATLRAGSKSPAPPVARTLTGRKASF